MWWFWSEPLLLVVCRLLRLILCISLLLVYVLQLVSSSIGSSDLRQVGLVYRFCFSNFIVLLLHLHFSISNVYLLRFRANCAGLCGCSVHRSPIRISALLLSFSWRFTWLLLPKLLHYCQIIIVIQSHCLLAFYCRPCVHCFIHNTLTFISPSIPLGIFHARQPDVFAALCPWCNGLYHPWELLFNAFCNAVERSSLPLLDSFEAFRRPYYSYLSACHLYYLIFHACHCHDRYSSCAHFLAGSYLKLLNNEGYFQAVRKAYRCEVAPLFEMLHASPSSDVISNVFSSVLFHAFPILLNPFSQFSLL